jgi:hypothetical protein
MMPKVFEVVIDHDILGWADQHEKELLGEYKGILQVSKHAELPESISDEDIAEYCKRNHCDLMTGDKRSYVDFFQAGINRVSITRRDVWKANKPIFLIQIQG